MTMPLLLYMSTVWCIEKEYVSSLRERTLKTKKEKFDTHRDYLASPTNCCPPLPGHWPGCQINGPRTSGTYWNYDNKSWPGVAWESVVKKKWKNQTHRLMEDTRGNDHSSRNNWHDSGSWPSPGCSSWVHKTLSCSDQHILYLDWTA